MRIFRKNQWIDKIKSLSPDNLGITIRKLSVVNTDIYVLYIQQLIDRTMVSDNIIKPILQYKGDSGLSIETIAGSVIYADNILMEDNKDKILDQLVKGYSIIISLKDSKYIAVNLIKVEKRTTESPELEYSLRGSKDSFIENLDSNLSLIRYRIKDPNLRIEKFTIGRRTKTNVALVYINDIANAKHIGKIENKLKSIDVDGIMDSGDIQKFISDDAFRLFPQVGIAEKPDILCSNVLEGRAAIVVEGSNLALITPKTFIDFLDSPDDHYDNLYIGIFSKFIRIFSIFITLTLSALYVAVIAFHSDILPAEYLLAIASARATVPFSAFTEAIGMELMSEVLREASIRLPRQIGPAIGIVGTIVIGQAAVSAGLVSPLMVIIVALATMASFIAPDYTIMNPVRLLKFGMIIITGMFGLFGFTLGLTVVVINLVSTTTSDVPYASPIAPFRLRDLKNFILSNILTTKKRPETIETIDDTKQR